MALKEIIKLPDPLLRKVSEPVERIDDAMLAFVDDMLETMYEAPGIGLAGVQVALPRRVIVCDIGDPELDAAEAKKFAEWEEEATAAEAAGEEPPEKPEKAERVKRPVVLINPEIVAVSDTPNSYEEGCLSIPDYFADVERPASCTVEYLDRDGDKQVMEASGLMATCVQHEIDHLDGRLFIDHISKLKRDMVIKKFIKVAKQSGKGPVSPLVM